MQYTFNIQNDLLNVIIKHDFAKDAKWLSGFMCDKISNATKNSNE